MTMHASARALFYDDGDLSYDPDDGDAGAEEGEPGPDGETSGMPSDDDDDGDAVDCCSSTLKARAVRLAMPGGRA